VNPPLRAPREHGRSLFVPPLSSVDALLAGNRRLLDQHALRTGARRDVLAVAAAYHRAAGEIVPDLRYGDSLIVGGHQPELFHPGVWFKNFVLHKLAQQHRAVGLNLIIDTDTAKPAVMRIPGADRGMLVPYDRSSPEVPYEERHVADEEAFASFPMRAMEVMRQHDFEPILPEFWRRAIGQAQRTPLLGERFVFARRELERRWGVAQREAPMSQVCATPSFARFAWMILHRLADFVTAHNRILDAYRSANRMRSRLHPFPDLASDGDWLEAPFWAWRTGERRRHRLFVNRTTAGLTVRAGNGAWPTLPIERADDFIAAWIELQRLGYKIRSRALTTTMFARLFLADLFVHGIGGGIYDEVTDFIIRDFFQREPPAYLIASATLLLPLPRHADAESGLRRLERRARDLQYKPELFIAPGQADALVAEKRGWIASDCQSRSKRVERFYALRRLNQLLLPYVENAREQTSREIDACRHKKAMHELAAERDWAFCLYPEPLLQKGLKP
jgi:hypothetical protein